MRLRHDNSQIQFEAIVSSPSNPFVQDSQILTERQKEMVERQRLTGGLFANMGGPSPQRDAPPSPLELPSDIQSTDDLHTRNARTTPLKTLAKVGPMDVFLGSSPTPHGRRTSQKIVSDDTDIATPTAGRTVRVADDEEIGSSPPRFEKTKASKLTYSPSKANESYEDQQHDSLYSASFDDGTTMDEEALAAAVALAEEEEKFNTKYDVSDDIMSDVPSSTIDLELTAQIDADMQSAEAAIKPNETVQESNSVFVDAASHFQSYRNAVHDGSDTEVEPTPKSVRSRKGKREAGTSSTSRVGDSFVSTPGKSTPDSQDLRRSTRHSMEGPIHIQLSAMKRQKKPRRGKKELAADGQASSPHRTQLGVGDEKPETAITASPTEKTRRAKKRKSMIDSPIPSDSLAATPESGRKRGLRRTQSNLSQVESVADVAAENTPAPSKRARQSLNKDVSEAKSTPPPLPEKQHSSQNKRLSHVQVTPRHEKASAPAVAEQIAASIATVTSIAPITKQSAPVQSQIQSQEQAPTGSSTPNRSFAERVILTPRSIINKIKELKNYFLNAPSLAVSEEEERELDDALFHIRVGVHAAGRKGRTGFTEA